MTLIKTKGDELRNKHMESSQLMMPYGHPLLSFQVSSIFATQSEAISQPSNIFNQLEPPEGIYSPLFRRSVNGSTTDTPRSSSSNADILSANSIQDSMLRCSVNSSISARHQPSESDELDRLMRQLDDALSIDPTENEEISIIQSLRMKVMDAIGEEEYCHDHDHTMTRLDAVDTPKRRSSPIEHLSRIPRIAESMNAKECVVEPQSNSTNTNKEMQLVPEFKSIHVPGIEYQSMIEEDSMLEVSIIIIRKSSFFN